MINYDRLISEQLQGETPKEKYDNLIQLKLSAAKKPLCQSKAKEIAEWILENISEKADFPYSKELRMLSEEVIYLQNILNSVQQPAGESPARKCQ